MTSATTVAVKTNAISSRGGVADLGLLDVTWVTGSNSVATEPTASPGTHR
jgi:hypothetical protein